MERDSQRQSQREPKRRPRAKCQIDTFQYFAASTSNQIRYTSTESENLERDCMIMITEIWATISYCGWVYTELIFMEFYPFSRPMFSIQLIEIIEETEIDKETGTR